MSISPSKRFYTPEEYLALESRSETKHEYWHGEIFEVFAMSGGSLNHSRIAGDIARLIKNLLNGKSCEAFNSDVCVKVSSTGVYTYPDVSIACPPLEVEVINGVETPSNPVALFEVTSPTSEARDRGKKLAAYQQIPSLQEYCIVSQDEIRVDHLVRTPEGWRLTIHTHSTDIVRLESISFDLRVSEIYCRTKFLAANQET